MIRLVGKNLVCERGGRRVFDNVSFTLDAGEGLLLTGPNGAGKSSLLRLIAGLLTPAGGAVVLEGLDRELPVGSYCHFIGHLDGVKTAMSVAENLEFWAGYLGGGDIEAALGGFDLGALRDLPAGYLSAGQKRRLALARLVLVRRPLWLLDEPTVSLDKASRQKLATALTAHLKTGGLAVASSHAGLGVRFDHGLDLGGLPPVSRNVASRARARKQAS